MTDPCLVDFQSGYALKSFDVGCIGRPRWLNWMRRPTGDQEVAVQAPPRSATFFRGD